VSTLADIFGKHGAQYPAQYGKDMLPGHRQAMGDIILCRTESLGAHIWWCENCGEYHYSYHSCKNRHCPQCQNEQADDWLQKQSEKLLPVEYFMVTFTLPEDLRRLVRSHQKVLYHLFFRSSSGSLQLLAKDPRFVGAEVGMIGVLQTWTRALEYHPHIHYIIPGLAISSDEKRLIFSREGFLIHVKPLSILFRGKFKEGLKKAGLLKALSPKVWRQDWVVHIQPVGKAEAALKYLAAYLFRIAISNKNILSCKNGMVTFRYRDRDSGSYKPMSLPGLEFMRRFLQHVLPKGFQKIRYYGFLSPKKKGLFQQIQLLLKADLKQGEKLDKKEFTFNCPQCNKPMILVKQTHRKRGPPLEAIFLSQTDTFGENKLNLQSYKTLF
jgi:hypothetical protein